MAADVQIMRICDPASPEDGGRLLVDRVATAARVRRCV